MVQYTDELKEEIRSANDIVDVISQYVTLKRSGRNFSDYALFIKKNHLLFLFLRIDSTFIVLDVIKVEMSLHSLVKLKKYHLKNLWNF